MEKVTYYGETDGVSLEQMIRLGSFNMRVKHFHPQYEIFYIVEGKRIFFFNNREYLAGAGDLILVNSNLIHMTRSADSSDQGHNRIILYLSREKMKSYEALFPSLHLIRFFDDYYGIYHLDDEQKRLILSLFQSIRRSLTDRFHDYRTGIDLEILSWLFKIIKFVRNGSRELPRQSDDPRYLEETELSISELSHLPGFENVTYFERIFKRYTSLSPLKYRKNPDGMKL